MVELTQEEALALAEALDVESTFGDEEELRLMQKQADPALLSGMQKLFNAERDADNND